MYHQSNASDTWLILRKIPAASKEGCAQLLWSRIYQSSYLRVSFREDTIEEAEVARGS